MSCSAGLRYNSRFGRCPLGDKLCKPRGAAQRLDKPLRHLGERELTGRLLPGIYSPTGVEASGANDVSAVPAYIHAGQKACSVGDLVTGMTERNVPAFAGPHHQCVRQPATFCLGNGLVIVEIEDDKAADRPRDNPDVGVWCSPVPCLDGAARCAPLLMGPPRDERGFVSGFERNQAEPHIV